MGLSFYLSNNRSVNISSRCFIASLLLLPCTVQAVDNGATTSSKSLITHMQKQIDGLNRRVEKLEQRLQILSQKPAQQRVVSQQIVPQQQADKQLSTPPKLTERSALTALQVISKLHENWKQLKRGLPKASLQQLLGKPSSELKFSQQTLWYYKYTGIGNGSVMLNQHGKVSGWQIPPFPD